MLTLKYFGHCSFEFITSKGMRIIIDPYKNSFFSRWFKYRFPRLRADILLITHNHFDHNAISRIKENPKVINKPIIVKNRNYIIKGIKGNHARSKKYNFYQNTIFLLELNKIRFCHWGDNDANINKNLLKKLGKIDILMLPIDDSEHLLTLPEVDKVIKKLSPQIIIPMHYFDKSLSSFFSPLGMIKNWLNSQKNVKKISNGKIRISKMVLPKTQEVWIFTPLI